MSSRISWTRRKKAYRLILNAISSFSKDIDQSLTKFTDATIPVFNFLKIQEVWKAEQRFRLPASNDELEFKRRKGKDIDSRRFEDLSRQSPKKKSMKKKKREKRRFR
jgi:hypothetical protein